jgi:acetyl esterase/lipase
MTSDGFAAIGFVSAYTGYRLEMRSPAATFFTDFRESLVSTVHDVQMILNYLASRGDLDMNRVGMYGQGSGGTIAILSASVDRRIRALDVLTPWADWPTFFAQTRYVSSEKRAIFLAPDFQKNIAPFDPITVLPKVQTKRIRLDNVRKSGPMPDDSQAKLEAAALRTTVINRYGDPAAMAKRASNGALFAWLREQLQPNAKPPVALAKSQQVHYFPPETVNPLPPLVPLQDLLKQDQQKATAEAKTQQSAQKPKQQPQ